VLAVAGTDQADIKAGLSNYGTWVDVSAPAVAITTTFMGGDYGAVDGTSYATPFVAGIAGLLRSQNPGWSADMVRAQVIDPADDIDNLNLGFAGQLGSGRANANGAITTVAQPMLAYETYTVDGVANGRPEPDSSVDLDVTLYNDWADASSVQAALSGRDFGATELTRLCQELETLGKAGSVAGAEDYIRQIEAEYAWVERALSQIQVQDGRIVVRNKEAEK
jgi:subtilisin family serine protease